MPASFVLAAVLGVCVLAPTAETRGERSVPPIPAADVFVLNTNLRIRLMMRSRSLGESDDPGFVALFENIGKTRFYLNPYVESNITIYDDSGALLEPLASVVAQRVLSIIGQRELPYVPAGGVWSARLEPQYPFPNDPSQWRTYLSPRAGIHDRVLGLPAGSYTAKFTYKNYPGYTAHYDTASVQAIWEGQVETEPIRFSVTAGGERVVGRYERRSPAETVGTTERRSAEPAAPPCRPSDVAALERGLQANPDGRAPDEAVILLVGRCGNAGSFVKLRPMLDSGDPRIRMTTQTALRELTFVGWAGGADFSGRATPQEWEAWYRKRRGDSREAWARRVLNDKRPSAGQVVAADYVARLEDRRWLDDLLRAAERHRWGAVRIAAARGVAPFDREHAIALLRRELHHRDPSIAASAVTALNVLTGQTLEFDFTDSSARQRAVATYAEAR